MTRTLSVVRVQVPPETRAQWLAILADLERAGRESGRRLWVFRHPSDPAQFLEFSESPGASLHRSRAASAREAALEARLAQLGAYEPGAPVLWEEVALASAVT